MLRNCNIIIAKVKAKYWSTAQKFGIRGTKSVDEALAIYKENGNTQWYTYIQKEMKNVRIAFEAFGGGIIGRRQAWPKVIGIPRNPLPYDI